MDLINIIFIGIGAWLIFAALAYLVAIAAIHIVSKVKLAHKRRGATYV